MSEVFEKRITCESYLNKKQEQKNDDHKITVRFYVVMSNHVRYKIYFRLYFFNFP